MRRVSRTLLLIAAVSLPVSCVTAGGSTAESEARKAAMTADRQSVMLGVRSMEELRYAAEASREALGWTRSARIQTGQARQGALYQAYVHSAHATDLRRRSDQLSALGTMRLALRGVRGHGLERRGVVPDDGRGRRERPAVADRLHRIGSRSRRPPPADRERGEIEP